MSFGAWTTKNIFTPLGMTNSHFREYHGVIRGRAQGYVTSGDGFKNQVVNYASVGASGL